MCVLDTRLYLCTYKADLLGLQRVSASVKFDMVTNDDIRTQLVCRLRNKIYTTATYARLQKVRV